VYKKKAPLRANSKQGVWSLLSCSSPSVHVTLPFTLAFVRITNIMKKGKTENRVPISFVAFRNSLPEEIEACIRKQQSKVDGL